MRRLDAVVLERALGDLERLRNFIQQFGLHRADAALLIIACYFAYAFAALAVAWAATGRALRPVAEAEARERAFVCTASHDLVTPLMAVTANCDVLEAEASDQAGLAS